MVRTNDLAECFFARASIICISNCKRLKNVVTCFFDDFFQNISLKKPLDTILCLNVINQTALVSVN